MAVLNFSDALMEARRKAQIQGRPLSQQEMEGITSGYAQTAADRALQQKQIQMAEDAAEAQKQQFAATMQLSQDQMGMQAEQFAQTLAMNMAQNATSAGQFQQSLALQSKAQQAQIDAAQQAYQTQQTNTAISVGSSILMGILMLALL